ncbi:MAG: epoxyqueuosine reductase QueH [Desulfobulbaceae bacterium]|jgi:predicted adenine nucleotide alpha hydrolase (AANH) superfamily ATPase|nr:epoxyqueuosine reductase QueH [Desulfobulbaceae bacterium]MDY0349971.1 epoxyqueuosine reductase QueH [Desulfobulbaceae bacterium]
MNILLHVCCGPCAIYPLRILRERGHRVRGYFYNPNIHPFKEFTRRISALNELAVRTAFPVDIDDRYGLIEYLRRVVFHEKQRCAVCYDLRLEETARKAARENEEAFSTTLLYSKYQNHDLIKEKGLQLAGKYGVQFYYEDFRPGWQEGIDRAVAMGLYRQPYCGCIYSEQERYDRSLRKKGKRPHNNINGENHGTHHRAGDQQ